MIHRTVDNQSPTTRLEPNFLSDVSHPLFRGFIAACHNYIHHRPL